MWHLTNIRFENKTKNLNSMFLFPTDKHEVISTISDLKNKKAPGPDQIKSETLKEIKSYISTCLPTL